MVSGGCLLGADENGDMMILRGAFMGKNIYELLGKSSVNGGSLPTISGDILW